jgi:hypothetical protein
MLTAITLVRSEQEKRRFVPLFALFGSGLVEKLVQGEQFCPTLPLAVLRVGGREVTTGHHQTIERQIK